MLGASLLREIVQKEKITKPALILELLRDEIIKALKQKGEPGEQKDGMDMALVSINHQTGILQFAGANNPLYFITNSELQITNERISLFDRSDTGKFLYEIKPDKMPIAIYQKMTKFVSVEIKVNKGDIIYLFSDGFADQFGGPKGKKFKYKPLKKLLLQNANKPMNIQKQILAQTFDNWKNSFDQIDDVTIIGVKL
jgi:serine phosphatase RsbU (regulator of sigma subunit)